jgi:molecular chaperone DnaK
MSAPTPLRVRLPFRSEDEFAASYGAHVGRDGFFLATKAPKPVGAILLFDLILADGTSLLRGEGVVVRSSVSGERPGMTLRFVRLEAAGKALVERIVSGRPARGIAPAEAQAHPSAWAAPSGPSAVQGSRSREMPARPIHREAWAPPGGPTRQPPTPFHPLPAAPREPEEVSPEEISDASLLAEPRKSAAPMSEPSPAEAAESLPEAAAEEIQDAAAEPADATETSHAPVLAPAESSEDEKVVADAPSRPDRAEASVEVSRESAEGEELVTRAPSSSDGAEASVEASHEPAEGERVVAAAVETAHEPVESAEGEQAAAGPKPPWKLVPRERAAETSTDAPQKPDTASAGAPEPPLEDTSLEAWSAARDGHGTRAEDVAGGTNESAAPASELEASERVAVSAPEARPESAEPAALIPTPARPIPSPEPATVPRSGTPSGPYPPLDEAEVPELVVTEFKGPGPLRRPAGLEQTPASADVHAAITPPAGTLIVTPLDEPPPEPSEKFRLDAPVRGDEPLHVPESSFHDVAQALGQPGQERPTSPIPLLPSMETAAPDEMPVPPPPPLDVAPVLEEGAIRLETGVDIPRAVIQAEPAAPVPPAGAPVSLVPPAEARERQPSAPPAPSAEETLAAATPAAPVRPAPVGTTELGIEINAESVRASWFHDGRSEALVLDPVGGRHEVPVRLVREPGSAPRMLPPDAPEVPLWVGAPLPFLGIPAGSDAARTVARRWPALVVPDDRGEAAFTLEGGTVSAGELVATLLRWVRHRAEEVTSHQAGRVVITVPVAFNTVQRERLREAAERAGFEGVRLVQAPTAATMAFAHGRGLARRRILVFRMGASTCDIAVLAASGNDLDMVACGGDASLGTANFDEQIALALDKGSRADGAVLRRRIGEAALLRTQLEDATLKEGIIDGSRLTRAELEARTTTLVERGVLLAREVLRSASLAPDSLDELVLVGAATRLPHVKRMIEDAMGRYARTDVDASAAVSAGAATLAHLLNTTGPKSASRTALHEVLGVPLEIIAPELGQVRVLDRNTRLPAEKTLTLTLGLGTPLEVQVFQGTAKAPDPRSFLGLLRAPADRAGDWLLHLSLDTDGVLRADATNPSGKRQPLQLQMPAPSPEAETPPLQRVSSEPETPAIPPKQETGVLGGLKKLFGRR